MRQSRARAGEDAEEGRRTGPARQELPAVVIRFAGDSGDGMQLTGGDFTRAAALAGNDLATFPDYPAEIRAPAGSLAGVSGFQLQFSSGEVFTAGDTPDVLVAMNPAALMTNLPLLEPGGLLILDGGAFKARNLELAGFSSNPLEDGSLEGYRVVHADFSRQVSEVLRGSGLSTRQIQRTRNFFALGLLFWLYDRDPEREHEAIRHRFARQPQIAEANLKAFGAGYHYGENTELFQVRYHVPAAKLEKGQYRNITGNEATALGIVAAGQLAALPVYYASYPITPASEILHSLARWPQYGVTVFQAEDEIAAVGAAVGASFGGVIAVTATSGPGFVLKQESIGLAVTAELPLVVIDVQRAGPSTGMPTKAEQADLLLALSGRNGESPVAVLAPSTPADCFATVIEAVRLAIRHMCPVICLSEGSIASGSEPWKLPDVARLEPIEVTFHDDAQGFQPYARDPETLARPWALPGTPGLEHRLGGLEKQEGSGHVSYDPTNHERMTRTRQAKIDRIARSLPPARVFGDEEGELLIVGWGSTYGALHQATKSLREEGLPVSHLHLRYLNPLQSNVGELLGRFQRVLVPELNRGQLCSILRDRFLIDARRLPKLQGQPFTVREVTEVARAWLEGKLDPEHGP
ncbi:MAG: 2-oxoacid:acceptor oxidoreductase subunit alpha [Myxococcota bacterium]